MKEVWPQEFTKFVIYFVINALGTSGGSTSRHPIPRSNTKKVGM